ncbi:MULTISPECIES: TIGR00730 family Rossman fold protein [unclassified Aerococcus]|uniref:LOG family protein n=1 Tax=unclassified Aerococcus TaxID=2618060 RepID=UPI0025BE94AD|nr:MULTISPECIES: TIGR00730 family Rossman fold protein [unclassified Aerococcus]
MELKSVAVYLGSAVGDDPVYEETATRVGEVIAKSGRTLVYGGSNVGCMAAVANGALAFGGDVMGVVPQKLADNNIQHPDLTKLFVVQGMHERKAQMIDLSDGFIALPGGPGTMEELFEVISWKQVGYHDKPIGILNVNNYYDGLLDFLDFQVDHGFMHQQYRDMLLVETDPEVLLEKMAAYEPTAEAKWK